MEWLTDWSVWHWLVFGFALLIAEILIPGVFLLWWGLAALVVAGLSLFLTFSLSVFVIIYALLASAFSWFWWKYQHRKDRQDQSVSTLNQRDHAMLGKRGIVEEISADGIGRGRFGDSTWRIQGEHLQPQDVIEVVAVQGISLLVRKRENME